MARMLPPSHSRGCEQRRVARSQNPGVRRRGVIHVTWPEGSNFAGAACLPPSLSVAASWSGKIRPDTNTGGCNATSLSGSPPGHVTWLTLRLLTPGFWLLAPFVASRPGLSLSNDRLSTRRSFRYKLVEIAVVTRFRNAVSRFSGRQECGHPRQ